MKKYSFKDLFEKGIISKDADTIEQKIDKVEIPMIQRDYAQGRKTKSAEDVDGEKFLEAIFTALKNDAEMEMDFVYGSVEKENDKFKFLPLDGQQRLTTLWLLHWYIGVRENVSDLEMLTNFTYETRTSSRDFCNHLAGTKNTTELKTIDFEKENISKQIENLSWFHASYKKDPTIQAMLNMLDAIHLQYKACGNIQLFAHLGKLQFYPFVLNDFNLTDDLYIKMNARGKPLTNFENFKADLIKEIKAKDEKLADEISLKLDTIWTDIFWKNRSDDNRIDEIYFAFFNRYFLSYKLKDVKDESDEYYKYFIEDTKITYSSFNKYKLNEEIELDLVKDLQKILDNYFESEIINNEKLCCLWNKDFCFIPEYKDSDLKTINLKERVVFYAICKYLKAGCVESTSLQHWMRFIWNFVSVQSEDGRDAIRRVSDMKTAIEYIDKIENSHNIYEKLSNLNEKEFSGSLLKEQFAEEIMKAKKILENTEWEKKIINAENHELLKGKIGFLFQNDNETTLDKFIERFELFKSIYDKSKENYFLVKCLLSKYPNKEPSKEINLSRNNWKNLVTSVLKDCFKLITENDVISNDGVTLNSVSETSPEWIKNLCCTKVLENCRSDSNRIIKTYDKKIVLWAKTPGYWNVFGNDVKGNVILNDNIHKNSLLREMTKKCLKCDQHIKDTDFFWGLDIRFNYEKYDFIWNNDNTVCLVSDTNIKFDAASITDTNKFIDELKELLKRIPQ